MRASAVAGIVFANANDNLLNKLTINRSMASIPFGSRYRLIDFALSNFVNSGISTVGIITKENYRSLMDHLGNGIYWDLDRKNGGLYMLPPYLTKGVRRYTGTVDALMGALNFIDRCGADYIVISNADIIANIDFSSVIENHAKTNADITLIYHNGKAPISSGDTMILDLDSENKVNRIKFNTPVNVNVNYCIGAGIIGRELLINLINKAYQNDQADISHDVVSKMVKHLNIYGYEHKEFVSILDSMNIYYSTSMDLLNADVRKQLFNSERPIYTKTRDDMPTRYGTKANVNNCIVADGCVINGTVKNSILFRGITVEKGACIENSILMQGTTIGENCQLNYVISDKNAVIGADMILKGTKLKSFFVKKNQIL